MATKVWYSPSAQKFYSQGQYPDGNPAPLRQSTGIPTYGSGRPPGIWYSPSSDKLLQSFDGRRIAQQAPGYDAKEAQKTLDNLLNDIKARQQRAATHQQALRDAPRDLTQKNRRTYADLAAVGGHPENPKKKPSAFDRVIDVLSRGVYAAANVGKGNVERDTEVDRRLIAQMNPRERALYESKGYEGHPRGSGTPGPVGGLMSLLLKITGDDDARKPPEYASIRRKREQIDRQVPEITFKQHLEAAGRGFTGKDKTTYREVIEAGQGSRPLPSWLITSMGFAGDVVGDPTNLIPGKALTLPFRAGTSAVRGLTPTGRANAALARELSTQGDTLRSALAQELESGAINSRLFDRVVSPDLRVTGAQRLRSAREISRRLGDDYGARRFQDFFQSNLDAAVKAGTIAPEAAQKLVSGRHFRFMDQAVQATAQAARAQRAAPEAPSPASGVRRGEGARRFVSTVMERGRINQLKGTTKTSGGNVAPLARELRDIDDRLRAVGLDPNISTYVARSPKTQAMHSSAGHVQRWFNGLTRAIETGKAPGSRKVNEALTGILYAKDALLKRQITTAIGRSSNAAGREISRIVDTYSAQVARPSHTAYREALAAGDAGSRATVDAYRAWHAGLFRALSESLRQNVLDDISEQILKEAEGNPEVLAQLENFGKGVDEVPTPTPKTDAAFKELPPPIDDTVRGIIETSRQQVKASRAALEDTILDIVARADAIKLNKGVLTNSRKLDEHLDKTSNWHIPVLAQKSFNGAIDAFNHVFRAKAGLDPRINEQRLRYMGMSNENVAYRARILKDIFRGTSPKARKADFRAFLTHGIIDESGRMMQFQSIMSDILRQYIPSQVAHPFGPAGRMTYGDLSRWLPDKYTFPKETLKDGFEFKSWADIVEQVLTPSMAKDTDPLEMLWQFMIANEKVIAEKASLKSIADTFGIPKDNLASSALTHGNLGYVSNPKFGDEVYFHPEVSRQIDKFFELVHSPRAAGALDTYLQKVTDVYKQLVTTYSPVAWNVRNSIGDAFTGLLDGVTGAHGLASYRQASRAIRLRRGLDETSQEAIHTPGSSLADLGSPRSALFRTQSGKSVSVEETLALYNRHGLNTGFIQTDFGPQHANLNLGSPRGTIARFTHQPLQALATTQADFFRLAHFIDVMKRSTFRNIDDIGQEAAEHVRRFKFDYNDFTPMEKTVFSRVVPFYKFQRKNLPLMTAMLFAKPSKMLLPSKAQTAISEYMGYDSEGFMPDYDATSVMPEWVRDMGTYPIANHNGNTIFARPALPSNDPMDLIDEYPGGLIEQGTPALTLPIEMAAGEYYKRDNKISLDTDKDEKVSGKERLARATDFLEGLPQSKLLKDIFEGKNGLTPYEISQNAGAGTYQLTQDSMGRELSNRWRQFYESPEGQAYQELPPQMKTRKPPTNKQWQFVLDLLAQQNSIPRGE